MPFVLDNSVLCGWLFENQATAYTQAMAERLEKDSAVAPALLPLEYANVLRTACKRGVINAQTAQEMLRLLATLPIDIDLARPAPAQILDLALRHDLSSYDAAYLDLALRCKLPIATRDEALARAACVAGVGLAQPGP
ncbi:MAG: type II toxin-antitoxin system VapC family toxin [Ottowia sp.]|nr:type II toxin-antitoxin system VapC family toxin [Ottowia sp.]